MAFIKFGENTVLDRLLSRGVKRTASDFTKLNGVAMIQCPICSKFYPEDWHRCPACSGRENAASGQKN